MRELLRQGVVVFFRFADTHTQGWQILRQEVVLASSGEESETFRGQQSGFTTASLTTYLPSADAAELQVYAEAIVGACERMAVWRERHPEVTPEQAAGYLMDLFWVTCGVPAPARRISSNARRT
jgi:hypothetical protein